MCLGNYARPLHNAGGDARMTEDEYLHMEETAKSKHEFRDGKIIDMAGPPLAFTRPRVNLRASGGQLSNFAFCLTGRFMKLTRFIIGTIAAAGIAVSGFAADDPATPPVASNIKDGVTHITINAHNMTPKETFDEIAKQAHVEFGDNNNVFGNLNQRNWAGREVAKTIDVDLTDRPFWPAVMEICDQCGLSIQPGYNNNDRRIMLYNGGQRGKPPTFEKDGFVVEALSFNRQQNVDYALSNQSANSCGVRIAVFVDPALKVASFDENIKIDSAVDDAGNSWAPDGNQPRYGAAQSRALAFDCQVPLKFADNAGKKLTSLKFTMSMQASDETDALTVDKPLEAEETSKELGDVTVTFHSLKKSGNGYELKIGMSTGNNSPVNNLFNLAQTGKLTDENGKSYGSFGGGGGGSNNKVEYTFNYGVNGGGTAPGEPVKWVLEVPTKTHEMKVPVEFSDLPLP
jgi:hypothetical protein